MNKLKTKLLTAIMNLKRKACQNIKNTKLMTIKKKTNNISHRRKLTKKHNNIKKKRSMNKRSTSKKKQRNQKPTPNLNIKSNKKSSKLISF